LAQEERLVTRRKVDDRGIYAIRCGEGRAYVGSSNYCNYRWVRHRTRLRSKWHPNRLLQAAWDKQGESAFVLAILEVVGVEDDLFAAEQRWIDRLRSFEDGYNLAPRAGSSAGVVMSPETRARVAKNNRGRRQSPETCAKRSATLKALYSDSARRLALSLAHRGVHDGEKNSQSKLTESDVQTIRRLASEGLTQREIGARFNVGRRAIGKIISGKAWASTPIPQGNSK